MYENNKYNKGDYIMSKVKQYYADEAEKQVDAIIENAKNNIITKDEAEKQILNVENVNMLNIDAENVDEFVYYGLQ
tara:strand:+ start:15 stop:242 length:228 start_codon:yes stop_codon:yes gene_type:complete